MERLRHDNDVGDVIVVSMEWKLLMLSWWECSMVVVAAWCMTVGTTERGATKALEDDAHVAMVAMVRNDRIMLSLFLCAAGG